MFNRFSRPMMRLASFALGLVVVVFPYQAQSDDIEIFSSDESTLVGKPNVLIVIDNSANWSRQSQKWPGGLTQGQSEVRAIKKVIQQLEDNSINVGLLEYSTAGNANTNEGGYVRYHIRPVNLENKLEFSAELDIIFNNINDPIEKRSQGNAFGTLMWDVYNYLGGLTQSQGGAGTPASRADPAAYTSKYSQFRSPLTAVDFCRRTIVIFIGNNVQSGPAKDGPPPIEALAALGGDTSDIPFAQYSVTQEPIEVSRGLSTACYDDVDACSDAEDNQSCQDEGFSACYCSADNTSPCSQSKYGVIGTKQEVTEISNSSETTGTKVNTGEIGLDCALPNKVPAYACPPASSQLEEDTPAAGQTTETITSWAQCEYVATNTDGCSGSKRANYEPRGFRTTQTIVREVTSTSEDAGQPSACSSSAANCDTSSIAACSDGTYSSCVCDASSSTTIGCPVTTTSNYEVIGQAMSSVATPTGTFAPPTGGPWSADEWAKFLRQNGVPLPGSDGQSFSQVTTYTVDVFNAQQSADFSALLFNMARVGGGKYFQAKNEDQIVAALEQIFDEVQAVNSAFSSASLPVNSTNRSQNDNQVYIGLFRPDRVKAPRWFGNLKRYQLIVDSNLQVSLGDSLGQAAVNDLTGFVADCAVSYWTEDSGNYWQEVISDDPPAISGCATAANVHSDYPDGPFVEKGAAAQRLRESNSTTIAPDANGNYAVNRNMLTLSGSTLVSLSSAALPDVVKSYTQGSDTGINPQDEDLDAVLTETRASIHGDVVHSRPQPVNYGGSDGVVVYYGANDGAFRAVRGATGEELWSFVAPEHLSKLARLQANTPPVDFSGGLNGKPYFFDGSTGLFQTSDNSQVLIFPSQRRGGRKVYAFDVSNPAQNPSFLWSKGCPSLGSDIGCDAGFSDIGQTWSRPQPAFVAGYSETKPLLIFGGGMDACEDQDSPTPTCIAPKGSGVFVLDAQTGALVKYFDFSAIDPLARSVVADIALVDPSGDGLADYAYVATMGGAVYRIDFVDAVNGFAALSSLEWKAYKVAYTKGSGRKFLYSPALVSLGDKVYVAIGSGDREHPLDTDYSASIANRFYVFLDDLKDQDSTTVLNLDDTSEVADLSVDVGCDESAQITPSSDKSAYFIDLDFLGEQVVTTPAITAGQVFFSTYRATPPDGLSCTNSLGEARGYILDLLNGSGAIGVLGTCGGQRSAVFTGGGLPPSPVVATVPLRLPGSGGDGGDGGDGGSSGGGSGGDGSDGGYGQLPPDTVLRTVIIGAADKAGGASSIIEAQDVTPAIPSIRRPVSWRVNGDAD